MDAFVNILKNVIDEYGEDTFENSQKTFALLMDLVPDQKRNRLLPPLCGGGRLRLA